MTKAKAIILNNRKITMLVLSALAILSVFIYVLAVNLTVRNVVKRQAMERELSELTTRIGEKEFKYIHLKNSVTLEMAKKMGFLETTNTKFVSRKTSVAMADIALRTR